MGQERSIETRVLEATGSRRSSDGLGLAIEQSATWSLADVQQGADFSQATAPTTFYSRWGNPTVRRFEQALAELEGGQAALGTASGMGAIATALLHFARDGDKRIVAQRSLYSATMELMNRLLADYGVETTFVAGPDTDGFEDAIDDGTSLVYLETPSNPLLEISDIQAISQAASEHDVPVLVDNTFASSVNQRPLELGATVSLHSATKYLGGHSDVMGGALVADASTVEACWSTYKMLGPSLAPNDAFLIHRGLKTLALRIRQHNENALGLAEFLAAHPKVERVHHPGLKSHPGHDVATRQMDGYGGMLSFELTGGLEAGRTVMEAVEICTLGVSLGGVETLIQHPATMTHAPLSPEERAEQGIPEGLVRLSVGIEGMDDLRADLEQALAKV